MAGIYIWNILPPHLSPLDSQVDSQVDSHLDNQVVNLLWGRRDSLLPNPPLCLQCNRFRDPQAYRAVSHLDSLVGNRFHTLHGLQPTNHPVSLLNNLLPSPPDNQVVNRLWDHRGSQVRNHRGSHQGYLPLSPQDYQPANHPVNPVSFHHHSHPLFPQCSHFLDLLVSRRVSQVDVPLGSLPDSPPDNQVVNRQWDHRVYQVRNHRCNLLICLQTNLQIDQLFLCRQLFTLILL